MNNVLPERAWFEKADQDLEMARRALGPQNTPAGNGLLSHPAMCREVSKRLSNCSINILLLRARSRLPHTAMHSTRTGL